MKPFLIALVCGSLVLASGADASRVPRGKIVNVEKLINTQIASMFPEEPYFLIGLARGTYLEGFGAVFSAEVNLATGPATSPFRPTPISKEEKDRHEEKKNARLPALRSKMYTVVGNMASYLEALPKSEEFVLSVTLLRYGWEDGTGPTQIIMRVQRARLIDAQRANAKPDSVITVQEY